MSGGAPQPLIGSVEAPIGGATGVLTYREWPGDGAPILFLHGLASSASTWNLVAPLLAGRHRVVALNQRGHGGSHAPDDGYDFDSVVGDAWAVCRALGVERPLVVGQSWGGNVALHMVATAPPDATRGLVMVDGGFIEPSRRSTWEEAAVRMRPPNTDIPIDAFRARIRDRLGPRWAPAWESAILANFWVDESGILRRHLSIENHMKIAFHLFHHRPSELFPVVACRALFAVALGSADAPSDPRRVEAVREIVGEALAALGSRGQAVWMNDTIHDIQLQRPIELAYLIATLA
ncbi:MAG: alpha/beta hydrolase [Chloroflexota bacterium]|nr:MAG: alpha/beta hydrolase [Chloroflexota bacterium]